MRWIGSRKVQPEYPSQREHHRWGSSMFAAPGRHSLLSKMSYLEAHLDVRVPDSGVRLVEGVNHRDAV